MLGTFDRTKNEENSYMKMFTQKIERKSGVQQKKFCYTPYEFH